MYNLATLIAKDPVLDDGRVRIVVAFTGNAGEPLLKRPYFISTADTIQTIRAWAIGEAARMNASKTVADTLTIGQSVSLVPIVPPVPPAPTASQVWREKALRLQRAKALGVASASLAALDADVAATFQAGFLNDL